ncbi:hypothetical protein GLOTRDRAFT_44791 [Gloeophyllum trabeum ATCC 11539]|uniref:Uncharacterized protein n=1 Tax=Gloeophyllum trabeum (strain ATCC 11539 / FP-39264 / Madison 617) TaxID=670483 RepID=S7RHT9_GLOTA|nr:uncharacterized protein GLOTRDRAFT_44791 [Gloeophyllum trabeum ATCC 11539]EPQ53855.1 hypothetical protein GLOTRDRAFT_44791 [Gloeophyllum trabeum ATCC 11539]
MQEVITSPHFKPEEIRGIDFKRLDKLLDETPLPWQDPRSGWKESSITIGIPSGIKTTNAVRRADAATARAAARSETLTEEPPEVLVEGIPFAIPGFWHRSIPGVIRAVFGHDAASRDFHFHPYEQFRTKPDASGEPEAERIFDELYTSRAWLEADAELQQQAQEPGCTRPRAIAAIMLASDSTHVAQFGQAKLWPAYMYFGNQSKYVRCQPQSHAAHHIGYFPSVSFSAGPCFVFVLRSGAAAPLLAHCRRELFQGAWKTLLDDEFMEAYEHGIVITCVDGIERRIFPRIFVYSADYPEKVLIATVRDMGQCPCPRCLVTKDKLADLGSKEDRTLRQQATRTDDDARRARVREARKLIYDAGYVVNGDRVEDVLKAESLVPSHNTFSARLSAFGFNFFRMLAVDLMHEFELGVWKAVFTHLIRILEAHDVNTVNELNRR